jgi:hypothetical protein
MTNTDTPTPDGSVPDDDSAEAMSPEDKRHDQLTTAPNAVESDAAPRINVTTQDDGVTRIDWRDDAPVRPGPRGDDDAEKS